MVFNPKRGVLIFSAAALLFLTGCGADETAIKPTDALAAEPLTAYVESTEMLTSMPVSMQKPWTDEELSLMARTLSGECYEDKELDKRRVCEVILNRVSDGRFGDSICEVITAPNQFQGYWRPSRPVSENDLAVAEQTLEDWYENGCKALSPYLYFSAGGNRENTFYEDIEG